MEQRTQKRKQKKKKRRVLRYILIGFLVLLVAVGVYAFTLWRSLADTAGVIHNPVEVDTGRERPLNLSAGEPFSVLLLGVDSENLDQGRSDTIIVVTINPDKRTTKMLSIPRDTRVEIPGRGMDKINHAYAFGGAALAIETVRDYLEMPIDFYAEINMNGIQQLVNAVGGITVDNTLAFSQGGDNFPVGPVQLNGSQALNFVRMRANDPEGDFGRQGRQRQVIEATVREMASLSTITRFGDILNTVEGNMKTSVTFDEMTTIARVYNVSLGNVEQLQLRGSGAMIGGIYYQVIGDEELNGVKSQLHEHMGLN